MAFSFESQAAKPATASTSEREDDISSGSQQGEAQAQGYDDVELAQELTNRWPR
ncbi:MAG: hypothetical protein ND866_28295 [Pyrinomonadaceae bacterium]|nr:hypothetical protein [Pyrinomonadaceae bacterium]